MGQTQKDVIDQLARYSVRINKRRLTDWRQRGLLPELEEVRDARGRVAYVWNQANIVEQVVEVWMLFEKYGHASRLAYMLWLLGYDVRPNLVMDAICAPIISHWQFWSGGASADEQLFDDEQKERLLDTIDKLAQRIARRRERRPAGHPDFGEAADLIYRFLSALNDPTYPVEDFINDLAAQSHPQASMNPASDQAIIEVVEFMQHHLTPRHLAEVATNATWQEYCESREDFSILREIITIFDLPERVRSRMSEPSPALWMILRNGALGRLGPWIIIGDIAFRRAGYGQRISSYLSQVQARLSMVDLSAFDEGLTQYSSFGMAHDIEDAEE